MYVRNIRLHTIAMSCADIDAHPHASNDSRFVAALEGILKMKKISYIHAESYAAGELKRGTVALIEEHTPVIALCCNDSVMEKTMSNTVEVKARGAENRDGFYRGVSDCPITDAGVICCKRKRVRH